MAKRVAITIAGAVSLGSYEGGVLYELLRAFRTYNQSVAGDESRKIYIDVLTGASAGAMTAAMVAQRLMYDADSLEDAQSSSEPTNALYQAWVNRVSLMKLVSMKRKEARWHSLFSSDLIEDIGRDMLVDSMKKPGSGPHPAVEAVGGKPLALRVGFALTNMNGIDYMLPIAGSDEGGFNYTTSADQKLFTISGDPQVDAVNWEAYCRAAVASGAFPAAFRAQAVEHSPADYNTPRLPSPPQHPIPGVCYLDWQGPDHRMFAHCDGGVLQNQPLGIAKNLVDEAMKDRVARQGLDAYSDSGDRLYVFVSPHSVKSTAEQMTAGRLTIWAELKHLVHVYLRQSTFHDWITAESVNQKVTVLDARASQLGDVIMQGYVDPEPLGRAASELNAILMPDTPKSRQAGQDQASRVARLKQQYSAKYDEVRTASGPAAADAFIAALATLEAAAHLENRDKMKIVAVIASEKELAGAGLAAFVGFFRKPYRMHDYWMGRVRTREYLQREDVKGILGVGHWPEEADWKPLHDPSGVKMPVSGLSVLMAAILPAFIFLALRWLTWIVLAIVLVLALCGVLLLRHEICAHCHPLW